MLTRIPLFLLAALQASLLPGLARRLAGRDISGARRSLRQIVLILLGIGTMTTMVLIAVGPEVESVLFGPAFRTPLVSVVILSVASTLFLLSAALGQALLALGRPRDVAAGWVAGAVAFLAALTLPGGVPQRASTSFLIGSAVACLWLGAVVRRRFARLA